MSTLAHIFKLLLYRYMSNLPHSLGVKNFIYTLLGFFFCSGAEVSFCKTWYQRWQTGSNRNGWFWKSYIFSVAAMINLIALNSLRQTLECFDGLSFGFGLLCSTICFGFICLVRFQIQNFEGYRNIMKCHRNKQSLLYYQWTGLILS